MHYIIKLSQLIVFLTLYVPMWLLGNRAIDRKPVPSHTIIAANHISMVDFLLIPFALGFKNFIVSHTYRTMTANKYLGWPIGGQMLQLVGSYPAKPGRGPNYGIDFSKELLKAGYEIIMYPQGGLPVNGKPREPKSGIMVIASATKAQIMPIHIKRIKSGLWPKFKMTMGKVFTIDEGKLNPKIVMDKIYELDS